MNEIVAGANAVWALALLYTGMMMLRQGWQVWRGTAVSWWPVSALTAIGGVLLTCGLLIAQTSGWRVGNLPGEVFDRSGAGTALRSVTGAVLAVAVARRVWRRELLTEGDRRRVYATPERRPTPAAPDG